MAIVLERFVHHFIDKEKNIINCSTLEQNVQLLHPTIVSFFEDLTDELWNAEDSGPTVSGHFSVGVNPSHARPFIQGILDNNDSMLLNSTNLANLLYEVSPRNSSRGVLGVFLVQNTDTQTQHLAIYKIKCEDERLVRVLSSNNLPELEVQEVRNALLKELQKGAIIPHPNRNLYDLKVTDKQVERGTIYFGSSFLGCGTKKSDEHQIIKLVPELRRFALINNVQIKSERIPRVICALGELQENISIPILANVIESENLYGDGYSRESFVEFTVHSEDIKQLDVSPEDLRRKRNRGRKLIYAFRDQNYRGIEISGPPEILERIMTREGDTVVFRIETLDADLDIKHG